jgi:hypothetical protein
MLLEGHGRKRESTGIRRDASSPQIRKDNRAAAEAIYHARMTQLARRRVGLPIDSDETFLQWSTCYEQHHTAKQVLKPRQHLGEFRGRDRHGIALCASTHGRGASRGGQLPEPRRERDH